MDASGMQEKIANELEGFIRESFAVPEDDELFTREVNLWEEGFVDSAGVVELIDHLETTYACQVPPDVLFDPAFTSINGIARFIAQIRERQAVAR